MKNIFSACKKYGWILLSITTTNATVIPQKKLTKTRIAKKIRNKKLNDKKSKLAPKTSQIENSASQKKKNYKKIELIIGVTILSIGVLCFVIYSSNSEKNNKQKNQGFDKLFQDIFEGKCNIPVTKPSASDDNDFTRSFKFGSEEWKWNQDLGNLQQGIKLEDCQINPDFLHAVFKDDIKLDDQDDEFDPDSNRAGNRLIAIFDKLNFHKDTSFNHWERDEETCTKNEFSEALKQFDDIMMNKNKKAGRLVDKKARKMFYYILGKMEKLEVGQNGNNPLSVSQQEDRAKLQTLFKEIPTMMRECKAIFTTFIDEAVIALGLRSDHAVTFTGKVYVYLLKYINTQLNGAVQTFIIRRYAWNHQVSLEAAQRAFASTDTRQHAINGFKKALSGYINIDSNDLHSTYSSFAKFVGDDLDDSEPIIKMFLQGFYTEYLSAEKIVNHLAVAIPNPYNPEIKMTSYSTFAHDKGVIKSNEAVDTTPLYDDGDYEKLNKNILTKILFNTKILIKK